jgi:hypothetical protein
MRRAGDGLLTSMTAHIRAAFPRDAAKHVARSLGDCSDSQAWRIVKTGHVPGRWRTTLLRILDGAIERNEVELRRLREELKLHEFTEARNVAASAARVVGKNP